MLFKKTAIEGVIAIEPERRLDDRGFFARMFCERELAEAGLTGRITQVNTAVSTKARTLRGLHFQDPPHAEVKIVRCLRGAVFDVAVDLRSRSPTYKQWYGLELTQENGLLLYIPTGCAHGYLTLSAQTELMYFTSVPYAAAAARGVRYNDPAFGVKWPAEPDVISAADRGWPNF